MTKPHRSPSVWFLAAVAAFFPLQPATAVESPVIGKLLTSDFVVEADGTYIETNHGEFLAKNESAAQQVAQQSIRYSDSMAELEVVEAYTLKADGTKIPVDASAIFTQLPQGAPNVPSFNDQKQKVIVFPNVAAGDAVVYTTRQHTKHPFFPGYFFANDAFPRTLSIQEYRGSLVAPKSMPLAVEGHGMTFAKEEKDSSVVYRWSYAAPDALSEDNAQVSLYDLNPRYFVSSFRDYDEFARAYESLTAPLIVVTPKIQAQADAITAGISDRREQAKKLYEWVSARIRYVAVQLGRGAIVPHSAEAVLANGYGDCKDHTVIYAALLKAKGIDSEIVLINLDNAYSLSVVPTLAQLNHAITWLPEFKLYVDTTIGVAPFGDLAFQEYGKPVIHATAAGNARRSTPIVPSGATSVSVKTTAKLDLTGRIIGETRTVATGPYGVTLRLIGLAIEARGSEGAAAIQLQSLGVPGTGSFDMEAPSNLAPSYTILGRFDAQPQPQYMSGAGFGMMGGLRLIDTTGDLLMGPLWNFKLTGDDPTPCFSGHTDEELSLELPPGKHLVKLPADVKIADDHLQFTAHWSQEGKTVKLRRDFTVTIDQPVCTGETRKSAAKALSAIRDSFRTQISLADD